jgi:nucleotide-binding universal stress UspA family protein
METKSNTTRFTVLAAIDGCASTEHVVASASRLAGMIAGGELHLLHVVDRVADAELSMPGDVAADQEAKRRLMIEGAAQRARALGTGRVIIHLLEDEPARGILAMATELRADLVIVGTHGRRGIARAVMGSIAELVVRRASCPVLVVREKSYADEAIPAIDPPCPDCVATRHETQNAQAWCARHAQHHPRPHLHYEFSEPFAAGSMLIRP